MDITRRDFFKLAGLTAVGVVGGLTVDNVINENNIVHAQAPIVGSKLVKSANGSAAKVYFTKKIDSDHLIKLYDMINNEIFGKIAIKVHTGEPEGPNILPRDMVQKFQEHIPNSTIVETNTMYGGARFTTEGHRKTLETNGWTFSKIDILDEEGDINLPVRNGFYLNEVSMGSHLVNYDSLIVLTHFKGHSMGGFGGSLKNIAIGCASGQHGKRQVHGYLEGPMPFGAKELAEMPLKEELMERMVDSASATCDYFGKKIVFLNVMRRMSVDCDCAGIRAKEPTMADIGICASTDILAIDQACIDMVYSAKDSQDLRERIESRHGLRQLSAMAEKKMGNPQYELIEIK
ncbi:MAG: DUF362 domain-containing protein [Selenomonadaceae bacterium]|nr:DUF362 domain-containing protein [Selenomonadaceae bacterium]